MPYRSMESWTVHFSMPSAVLPIKGALSAFHGNADRPARVAPGAGRCGIRCREMLRRWFTAAPTSTHYRLEQTTCQGVAGKSSHAPPDRQLRIRQVGRNAANADLTRPGSARNRPGALSRAFPRSTREQEGVGTYGGRLLICRVFLILSILTP